LFSPENYGFRQRNALLREAPRDPPDDTLFPETHEIVLTPVLQLRSSCTYITAGPDVGEFHD
jgi:hypothetical protein